jgi:hypothetical protein
MGSLLIFICVLSWHSAIKVWDNWWALRWNGRFLRAIRYDRFFWRKLPFMILISSFRFSRASKWVTSCGVSFDWRVSWAFHSICRCWIIICCTLFNCSERIMLTLLNNHIGEIKALFNCFTKLLLNPCLPLSFLKFFVRLYAFPNDTHIWIYFMIEGFYKVSHVFMILPAFDFLEKTQEHNDCSGWSAYAWCSVDIHIQVLIVQHVI